MYHIGLNYVYSCLYNHHMDKKRTWACTTLSSYVALSRFQAEYQFGKRDFKESCESITDTWLLKFKSKCKHIHLGPKTGTSYSMLDDTIELSNEEKDLGITIDSKLNFQQHINIQVKKANKKLGIINRTFNYMDKEMF